MARRRLNKKVLLLGIVVALVAALAAIFLIAHYSKDPGKFISDGDAAFKEKQYDAADRNYRKAYAYSKNDELKIDILYKLVELHMNTDRWRDILGFWTEIVKLDPQNVKARFALLRYFYIIADGGGRSVWKDIKSRADEFFEKSDEKILSQNISELDYFDAANELKGRKLGPYLYMVRGRAILENTIYGAETDPQAALAQAKSDIEKAIEIEPGNVENFWYLALIVKENGRIAATKGNVEERDKALKQAQEILEKAVKIADDNPYAHINLLTMKLGILQEERAGQDKIKALEPDYLALAKRFSSNSGVFTALFGYYVTLGTKEIDNAIAAAEKACMLDDKNVVYAINTANSLYRRYLTYAAVSDLDKVIEISKKALELPDAQDKPGPKSWRNKTNRITLYILLGQCYLEKILDPSYVNIKPQVSGDIKELEQVVYNIGQLYGSGEEPQVRKWQGILEYVAGNKNEAVKKLYATYEQLSAAGGGDWLISYMLGKRFINTSELGAARVFLYNAISTGAASFKPDVLLDYTTILLKFKAYDDALNVLRTFDEKFGESQKSRLLKIEACIGSRQFDEAEKEIVKAGPKDPNIAAEEIALIIEKIIQIKQAVLKKQIREQEVTFAKQPMSDTGPNLDYNTIQGELENHERVLAEKVRNLLSINPNLATVDSIVEVCENYISKKQIDSAKEIVASALKHRPDNITLLAYSEFLKEPNLADVTQQRRKEIQLKVLEGVKEPIDHGIRLGIFYQSQNELDKAIVNYKAALKAKELGDGLIEIPPFEKDDKLRQQQVLAISNLFDVAIEANDLKLAEQLGDIAKRENIDECEGQFIQARLALAKNDMKNVIELADKCLSQRPVFSYAYAIRSAARASLGDLALAVDDARKAAEFNPLDRSIAKALAKAIYQRNTKIGSNVTSAQVMELRDALIRAMSLNPNEIELQSFYAEFISSENPDEALAIRQRLRKVSPSVDNELLLGRMAMRVGLKEKDKSKKDVYFGLAANAFEQALRMAPQNQGVLSSYAEYYRLTGQEERAVKLLEQSQTEDVLFAHYMRAGQHQKAKDIAVKLYEQKPKDPNSIKKILFVANTTYDKEAIKRFFDELLAVENTKENQLYQIQSFLKVGLLTDAQSKLEKFNEAYPKEPMSLLLSAWLSMIKGQMDKALEQVNQSLQIDSTNPMGWRLRGEINRLLAKYNESIDDLKKSKSLLNNGSTSLLLARAYIDARLYEDAITELKDTITQPDAPADARVMLEWVYMQAGKNRELNDFYRETLKTFPDDMDWHNKAAMFAMKNNDYVTAEKLFYEAWQISQQTGKPEAGAFDGYLYSLTMQKRYDKVLEEARKYTEGELAHVAFFRMGEAKKKLGDEETAKQYCKKAIEIAATKEVILTKILEEMISLFGPEEVEKYCSEKLNTDPNSVAANFPMAKIMALRGEYNKAINYLDKCINIVGTDNTAVSNFMMEKAIVLQSAYDKTSDNSYLQRSIEVYQSLIEKMPNNFNVMNNLAYMLAENNQMLEKAVVYAKNCYEIAPDNPGFMDTYAYVLYKNGKYEQAEQLVQSALQQYEKGKISAPWEVYEHVGLIKEALKKNPEALISYRKALEIGSDGLVDKAKGRIEAAIERVSK